MTEFNQDKFESDAKKLVAKYLNYEVNEKEVFIVWFSKVGSNAKAMLSSDLDFHYFEITYFGEGGRPLNEEDSDGESLDAGFTSGD